MREKVVFQANAPVTVALAYADGLPVQGRFGEQIMYTLTDERVMYVPPIVRNQLVDLGIQPGEVFTICKAERKQGNRNAIEWRVERRGAAHDRPPWETPRANGKANGHPVARPPDVMGLALLQEALVSSVDVAVATEQYAATKGLALRFGSEDLRAMALSLFIQRTREAALR